MTSGALNRLSPKTSVKVPPAPLQRLSALKRPTRCLLLSTKALSKRRTATSTAQVKHKMIEQNAKPGAIALDEMLNDIEVPSLDVPELGALLVSDKSKDLFEEKKRKAWKELDVAEARCDFSPNRMRITNRGGVFFITLWKKSVYGRTLTDIKGDDDMVGFFADNITPLIRSVLGSFLSPDDFAVVTTPKRRHKERNFATLIAIRIAEMLGLPFFEDCAFAPSKHRVGTVFTANNIPPQRNIIVFDDFVTTGQTLVSMQNLLVSLGKNCVFFAGINNKL